MVVQYCGCYSPKTFGFSAVVTRVVSDEIEISSISAEDKFPVETSDPTGPVEKPQWVVPESSSLKLYDSKARNPTVLIS